MKTETLTRTLWLSLRIALVFDLGQNPLSIAAMRPPLDGRNLRIGQGESRDQPWFLPDEYSFSHFDGSDALREHFDQDADRMFPPDQGASSSGPAELRDRKGKKKVSWKKTLNLFSKINLKDDDHHEMHSPNLEAQMKAEFDHTPNVGWSASTSQEWLEHYTHPHTDASEIITQHSFKVKEAREFLLASEFYPDRIHEVLQHAFAYLLRQEALSENEKLMWLELFVRAHARATEADAANINSVLHFGLYHLRDQYEGRANSQYWYHVLSQTVEGWAVQPDHDHVPETVGFLIQKQTGDPMRRDPYWRSVDRYLDGYRYQNQQMGSITRGYAHAYPEIQRFILSLSYFPGRVPDAVQYAFRYLIHAQDTTQEEYLVWRDLFAKLIRTGAWEIEDIRLDMVFRTGLYSLLMKIAARNESDHPLDPQVYGWFEQLFQKVENRWSRVSQDERTMAIVQNYIGKQEMFYPAGGISFHLSSSSNLKEYLTFDTKLAEMLDWVKSVSYVEAYLSGASWCEALARMATMQVQNSFETKTAALILLRHLAAPNNGIIAAGKARATIRESAKRHWKRISTDQDFSMEIKNFQQGASTQEQRDLLARMISHESGSHS